MSHPFREYEVVVLGRLLSEHYTREELLELLNRSIPRESEYTGYGFFVSAADSDIGIERRVYSDPALVAESSGSRASFVAFLEDGCLTLETFPTDGEALPATFRDGEVGLDHVGTTI